MTKSNTKSNVTVDEVKAAKANEGLHTLQTHLTEVTINFKSANRIEKLNLSDLPIETIDFLLQGGTRKFNDMVNSKASAIKESGKTIEYDKLVNEMMDKILSGNLSEMRTASTDKAFRDFLINQLKTLYKIPAKVFDSVKGATPEVILATAYPDFDTDKVNEVLSLFRQQYEQTQIVLPNLIIKA